MPIFSARSLGRTVIRLPPLTRTLGPTLVRTGVGEAPSERTRRASVEELISKLPTGVPIALTFDPNVEGLYAFAAHGFTIELDYTFRLAHAPEEGALWSGLRDYTRNNVRRASEKFTVEMSHDTARFVSFYQANIRRSGQAMRPDAAIMRKLVDASVKNNAGLALFCRERDGEDVGAIFLVWDRSWCYYLLSTRNKERSGKGGVSLLTWKALQWSREQGLGFDFDGSNRFVLQFGARPVPRWHVSRMHPLRRAAKLVLASKLF
jgi:hypothetical protein